MGTSGGETGTSEAGMSGAERRTASLLGTGFVAILLAVMVANAESMMSDFAAAGVVETKAHIWIWESTSIIAWLSAMPAIWWLVRHLRPPRFSWMVIAAMIVAASVPASLWHIGVMVGLRKLLYAAASEQYRFFGAIPDRLLYEYRKDFASYLQFAGLAAIAQWLLARARATVVVPAEARMLAVPDGAITHRVPIDEIGHVTAAGNYVELAWGQRTLLYRATLAAVAAELGPCFVRIHRSRLVRRAAVRRVETDRSGDFIVTLADGTTLRGSRRYRDSVQG